MELNQHLSAGMLALSGLAAGVTVGYCLAARGAVADASLPTIVLAAATVPCILVGQVSGQMLIATGDTAAWAWATILGVLVQLLVLAVWISLTTLDPTSAMAVALIGFFGTALMILGTVARREGVRALRPRWSSTLGNRIVTTAVGLHPGTIALQLGTRIDLLIVGALVSRHAIGLYSLALTLAGSAYLITQTLSLGAMHTQMRHELRAALRFTAAFTRQAIALALVTCAVISAIAYPFITLVYGDVWRGSVVPFVILLIAAIAMAPEEPVRQMLWRVGRPLQLSMVACAGVVLNAIATVAMVGPFGITGAALGSVIAFWVYAGAMVAMLVRNSELSVGELIAFPRRDDPLVEVLGGAVRRFRVRSSGVQG